MIFGLSKCWGRVSKSVRGCIKRLYLHSDGQIGEVADQGQRDRTTDLYLRPTLTRMILSWQRPLACQDTTFAIYCSSTGLWDDAQLIQFPIFCCINQNSSTIEYHCMTELPCKSGLIAYWLVDQTPDSFHSHGPYIAQLQTVAAFADL